MKNKFRRIKRFSLMMLLLSTGILIYSQQAKERLMPVTSNSRTSLSTYTQAMKYFDEVKLDKALDTFKKALAQDPDFFMANYQMAFFYLLNQAPDQFNTYSVAAINCKAKLTEAEELLKDVLIKLKEGRRNVTDIGRKLVEMYPNDPNAYNNLVYFQTLAGDTTGMVETLNKAIKVASNPAPFYNQLGYVYLTLKQSDKAEVAFDRYIELEPENPNVYDSKGDYYMYIKKYDRAFESYMKANSIDSSFSKDKAEMARQLYEKTEGRKLNIIKL